MGKYFNPIEEKEFKKGDYIVGDLCYLFNEDEVWDDFCNQDEGCLEFKEIPLFWNYTFYGDGSYNFHEGINTVVKIDNDKFFPVDAGLIGIISVDVLNHLDYTLEDLKKGTDSLNGVKVVSIKEDFIPKYDNEDGTFEFSTFEIYTGD